MREYEVTIIVQPQLDDEALGQLVERVSDWLAPDASDEDKPVQNHWGKRRLVYPIGKVEEGYYVMYEAAIDPTRITDIERNMQYAEDIIRYLVVRKED